MQTPTAEQLAQIDEMVGEYLIFRGYVRSYTALIHDRAHDRTKGFEVDRVRHTFMCMRTLICPYVRTCREVHVLACMRR